ncbi:hypothetical protein [Lewinella sp. IMCC34191]|uniref:hypothetical protein n=1 Tax=Lewinella sp. IMCC34191 TaxID=2259172 RepID=UPI000E27646D|nr:hypothetical protein [Lewinella sp. IMCC34191]
MLILLLLALLSGLAPRGGEQVDGPYNGAGMAQAVYSLSLSEAHLPVICPSPAGETPRPVLPLEAEEEETETEAGYRAHLLVRSCLSFFANFLAPSECLASPPSIIRKPGVLLATGPSRRILHQIFRI